jgi:hypothetical protein
MKAYYNWFSIFKLQTSVSFVEVLRFADLFLPHGFLHLLLSFYGLSSVF